MRNEVCLALNTSTTTIPHHRVNTVCVHSSHFFKNPTRVCRYLLVAGGSNWIETYLLTYTRLSELRIFLNNGCFLNSLGNGIRLLECICYHTLEPHNVLIVSVDAGSFPQ